MQRTARKATGFSLAAAFLLAGALLMHASAATVAGGHGNLGQALALRALSTSKSFLQGVADAGDFDPRHDANGRYIYRPSDLMTHIQPRAVGSQAASNNINFSEPVQTFDIFAPPPNFEPIGGTQAAPSPVNVPLTPTNLTPIFTTDQNYIIFASNRSAANPLAVAPDGHYHLWAILATGAAPPFQLTSGSGDEMFPALNTSNSELAFTSTARAVLDYEANNPQATTVPNNLPHSLFTTPFSETPGTAVDVDTLTNPLDTPATANSPAVGSSKTFAPSAGGQAQNIGGVGDVQRPTWDPISGNRLVFSALTQQPTDQTLAREQNPNHYHLYYLYVTTNGYLQQGGQTQGVPNPPAKLTDGPADDTDPTWEPGGGGDYIAFSSTTSGLSNAARVITPNLPPPAPAATLATTDGNRNIFVLNAGSGGTFGSVPNGGGRITNSTGATGQPLSTDNFGPAWSPSAGINQYINPGGNSFGTGASGSFEYLAFARGTAPTANHDIYYLRTVDPVGTATLTPEGVSTAGGTNNVVKLNVDDNGTLTTTPGTTTGGVTTPPTTTVTGVNSYDDIYPTWSLSSSIANIAYSSNRSVTYNNPVNGNPSETAISLPPGSANVGAMTGAAYAPGQTGAFPAYADVPGDTSGAVTGYTGILQSEVLNLNPPILRSYSQSEIVHVNQASTATDTPLLNSPRRVITPGSYVTFTVRLSDRESGIANSGANGLPDAYLQIKNPNSRYQDSQHLEHKVFATSDEYYRVTAQSTPADLYSYAGPGTFGFNNFNFNSTPLHKRPDSGSSTQLMFESTFSPSAGRTLQYGLPFNDVPYTNTAPARFQLVGAVGGPDRDAAAGVVAVGRDGGGTNGFSFPLPGGGTSQAQLIPLGLEGAPLAGGDWKNFKAWGPEYECQYVNPSVTATGNDPGAGDYGTPFYLAGYDDQGAFNGYDPLSGDITPPDNTFGVAQGGLHPPRPATSTGGSTAEWLQLQKVPAAMQDNQGGVLYYATWKTPFAASDWYLDVVAYDNARFPALPTDTSTYASPTFSTLGVSTDPGGQPYRQDNWRLFDNVWGFTTQANPPGRGDILVVSDYALGQKFGFSTFGGQVGASNLPPKLFGAESYVTDVDVNVLPNAALFNYSEAGATDAAGNPAVFPTATPANPNVYSSPIYPIVQRLNIYDSGQPGINNGGTTFTGNNNYSAILNGLGVASYYDFLVGQQDDKDPVQNQYPYVRSQQYVIWRTLARGPVDTATLTAFQPQGVSQPAVNDTGNGGFTAPAATVYDARRCVIWISPYTNDLLTSSSGSGSLSDPNVQASLMQFVNQQHGRLCVSGEDVGSGTVGSGQTTGTFLSSVLNASLANGANGTQQLAGGGGRITGSGQNGGGFLTFPEFLDTSGSISEIGFYRPSDRPLLLNNTNHVVAGGRDRPTAITRTDAADDQIGPDLLDYGFASDFTSQIDTINPLTGAGDATRPTVTDVTNGGNGLIYFQDNSTGARVVYAAFGLEGISTDYYVWKSDLPPNGAEPGTYKANVTLHFTPHNQRQNILHNIVDYLRTGTITGQVFQNANSSAGAGQPVVGATVYLRSGAPLPGARQTFSGTTDANGTYTITGIEPGTYGVYAYKNGFTSTASKTSVTVEGDTFAQEQALDIEPVLGGAVTGTVRDTSGGAIGGATVTFTGVPGTASAGIVVTTTTDANGNYSVALPVGTFTASANKLPVFGQSGPTLPLSPANPAVSNTGVITISSGTQVAGLNFRLSSAPGSITGFVTDTSNPAVPLAGVKVTATNGTFSQSATNLTDVNGAYTINNLPQGTYTLTATKATFTQVGTPPQVPVTAGTVTSPPTTPTIQLKAAQTVTLQGTVFANGVPQPGATVSITNLDGTVPTFTVTTGTPGTVGGTVTTDANGNYAVTILQGLYNLTASASGFNLATPSPSGNPVTVSANPTTVNFTLSVTPPVTTFTGGRYNFFSLPYGDESGSAFDSIFGSLKTTTNPAGNRSPAAIYQSQIGNYVYEPTAPADAIHIGRGYFIFLQNSVSLLNIPGTPPTGPVSVPLEGGPGLDGWNMIGVPSTSPISVASLNFKFSNGLTATFDQAVNSLRVIAPVLYGYDPTSNAYTPVTETGTLSPYHGYWIRAKVSGLTIVIPAGGATAAARKK